MDASFDDIVYSNATPNGGYAKTLFVGSNTVGYTTSPQGEKYDTPAPTLLSLMRNGVVDTADRGTRIVVRRGHVENVSAADYFSLMGARKRIDIIGEGDDVDRPTFTWTIAGSTLLMDTDSLKLENLRLFLAGPHVAGSALTVAAPITVTGVGCAIRRCELRFGFDVDQIVTVGLLVNAADFAFEDNLAFGEAAAKITAAGTFMRLAAADRVKIRRNRIIGGLTTNTDGLIETLTTASLNMDITDNYIYANGSGNTCAIDQGAALACTGKLQRNLMVVAVDATAETVVWTRNAANDMALLDNFLVNDNNERGLVIGTASA